AELEPGVLIARLGMRAQVIAKDEMLPPERAADPRQMNVVRARITAPKELASGNALLAPVDVTTARQSCDVSLKWCAFIEPGKNVDDRLCSETWHARAAAVLQRDGERRESA